MKQLRELYLENANISDELLTKFSQQDLPALEVLSLRYCQKISYKGLFYLQQAQKMPQLKFLYLDFSGVTLPMPKAETWKGLKITLRECKVIEYNNMAEYVRACEQVSEIEINAKLINNEVIQGIKTSKI